MKNDFNFDDLDRQLDDYTSDFNIDDSGGGRGIVENVSKHTRSVAQGLRETVGPKAIGKHLLKSMPYADQLVGELSDVAHDASAIASDIRKGAKPVVDATRNLTKYLIDSNRKFIPNKVYRRLDNFSRAHTEETDTAKATREDLIQLKLDEVFAGSERMTQVFKESSKQQLTVEASKLTISKQQLASLSTISGHLLFQNKFTISTTRNYMRKMLELNYRHLFLAKNQLIQLKALNSVIATSLSALVKNTSIPDSLKFRGLDMGRTRLYGAMYDKGISTLGGLGKRALNQAKNQLGIDGNTIADLLNMSTDGLQDMGELNRMNGVSGASAFLGSAAGRKIAGSVSQFANSRAGGAMRYTNRRAGGLLNDVRSGGHGTRMTLANSKSGMARFAAGMMGDDSNFSVKVGNSMLNSPTEAAPFDVLTRQTIVEVIPAWLSKIAKNTRDLFVGKETEREQYDVVSRSIVSERAARGNLTNHLFGDPNDRSSGYARSVGATMQAIELSGLSLAMDKATLEKNISKIVSNAIVMRLPLRAAYLRPVLQLTSDAQLTDSTLLKLADGVKHKVDTLHALYFTMVDARGKERFEIVEAINAGIYADTGTDQFRDKLAEMVDSMGYRNLFREHIDKDDTLKQSWLASSVRGASKASWHNEAVASGRAGYIDNLEQHGQDMANIEELKRSGLQLLDPKNVNANQQRMVKSRHPRNMRMIAKKLVEGDGLSLDDMLKTFETTPAQHMDQVKDMFNIVQQLKIIELERQLLKAKMDPDSEPLAMTHRTMQVPDIDFFKGDRRASSEFGAKYGRYGAVHRPYLMQAHNSILMRKTLEDIGSFLKARFSSLPSWRRLQIKTLEGIHKNITLLPGKLIGGIAKTLGATILSPFKMLWEGLTRKFEIGTGKLRTQRERTLALSKMKEERAAVERQVRTMLAVERSAKLNSEMLNTLIALNQNAITDARASRLLATGTDGGYVTEYLDKQAGGPKIIPFNKAYAKELEEARERARRGDQDEDGDRKAIMTKYDGRVNQFRQHVREVDIFSKAAIGLKIGAISVITAAVLKQIFDIRNRGAGSWLRDLGIRAGVVSRFDGEAGLKSTGRQNQASHQANGALMDEYAMDTKQRKEYETALASGNPNEAAQVAERIRRVNMGAGKIKVPQSRGSFKMYFQQDKFDKDVREAVSVSAADRYTMQNYLQRGDDAGYKAFVENLKKANKMAIFGGNVSARISNHERALNLIERRKVLIGEYKLARPLVDEYIKLVMANRAQDAAIFIADIRQSKLQYDKSIESDIKDSVLSKVWDAFFTDGSLAWSDYGINRFQESMVRRLNKDRFNYEAQWLLEDIHWSLYANSQYDKQTQHAGGSAQMGMSSKVIGASLALNPKITADILKKSPVLTKMVGGLTKMAGGVAKMAGGTTTGRMLAGTARATISDLVGSHAVQGPLHSIKTLGKATTWLGDKMSQAGGAIKKVFTGAGDGFFSKWISERPSWMKDIGSKLTPKEGSKLSRFLKLMQNLLSKTSVGKVGKVLGGFLKGAFATLKWIGALLARFAVPITIGLFIAGIIRGMMMGPESGDKFDAKFSGSKWSIALNIVLTAIDPYESGIALVRCIKMAGEAYKASKAAKESGKMADSMQAEVRAMAARKLAEMNPDKPLSPEVQERLKKLIGDAGAVAASDEDEHNEKADDFVGPKPLAATTKIDATKAREAEDKQKMKDHNTTLDKQRGTDTTAKGMGAAYTTKMATASATSLGAVSFDDKSTKYSTETFKWSTANDLFTHFKLKNEKWLWWATQCLQSPKTKYMFSTYIASMVYETYKQVRYVPGNAKLGIEPYLIQQGTPPELWVLHAGIANMLGIKDASNPEFMSSASDRPDPIVDKQKKKYTTSADLRPPDPNEFIGPIRPQHPDPSRKDLRQELDPNGYMQQQLRMQQLMLDRLEAIANNSQSFTQMPGAMGGLADAIVNAPGPKLVLNTPTPEVSSYKAPRPAFN